MYTVHKIAVTSSEPTEITRHIPMKIALTFQNHYLHKSRGVHHTEIPMGPMGIPWEWEA